MATSNIGDEGTAMNERFIQEELKKRQLKGDEIRNTVLYTESLRRVGSLIERSKRIMTSLQTFQKVIEHMEVYAKHSNALKRSFIFKRKAQVDKLLPTIEHILETYQEKTPEILALAKLVNQERPHVESLKWLKHLEELLEKALKHKDVTHIVAYFMTNHQAIERHIESGSFERGHQLIKEIEAFVDLINAGIKTDRKVLFEKVVERLKQFKLKEDNIVLFQQQLRLILSYAQTNFGFNQEQLEKLKGFGALYDVIVKTRQELGQEDHRLETALKEKLALKSTELALNEWRKLRGFSNEKRLLPMAKILNDDAMENLLAFNREELSLLGAENTSGDPKSFGRSYIDETGTEAPCLGKWRDAEGNWKDSLLQIIESTRPGKTDDKKEERTWREFREFIERKQDVQYLAMIKQWDKLAYQRLSKLKGKEIPVKWEEQVNVIIRGRNPSSLTRKTFQLIRKAIEEGEDNLLGKGKEIKEQLIKFFKEQKQQHSSKLDRQLRRLAAAFKLTVKEKNTHLQEQLQDGFTNAKPHIDQRVKIYQAINDEIIFIRYRVMELQEKLQGKLELGSKFSAAEAIGPARESLDNAIDNINHTRKQLGWIDRATKNIDGLMKHPQGFGYMNYSVMKAVFHNQSLIRNLETMKNLDLELLNAESDKHHHQNFNRIIEHSEDVRKYFDRMEELLQKATIPIVKTKESPELDEHLAKEEGKKITAQPKEAES